MAINSMGCYNYLPKEVQERVLGENVVRHDEEEEIMKKFMKPLLKSEKDLASQSKLQLHLDKEADKKRGSPATHHYKRLSYKERRNLGLYSVQRDSMKYEDLLPLNVLWNDYMRKYLNIKEAARKKFVNGGNHFDGDTIKLYRADYHGAELLVKRSVCPGYVGKSGIVAMETKNCFLLVGKDSVTRTIPKVTCEFSFEIDQFRFTFFGRNFVSRPADRSSKKIKTIYPSSL